MPGSSTGIRSLAIALLLVAVGFGAYYFIYLQQHERELAQHHLRLLKYAGSTTSDVLEGLFGSVTYAVTIEQSDVERFKQWHPPSNTGIPDSPARSDSQAIESKLQLIRRLQRRTDPKIGSEDPATFLADTTNRTETVMTKDSPAVPVRLGVALDIEPNNLELVFAFARHYASTRWQASAWQADLHDLLARALPTDAFAGVVLARSNGDVLFEEGDSPLRLRQLQFPKAEKDAPSVGGLPISQTYDLSVAGENYRFFVQPIEVPIPINLPGASGGVGQARWQTESYWYLAGFLPEDRYRTMTMAVPSTIVLLALGLIVVGLLCLPLLKVRYLGPREALRRVDVYLLATSIIVGASLVTCGFLYHSLLEHNADETNRSLDDLWSDVSSQFHSEMDRMDDALVTSTIERDAPGAASRAGPVRGVFGRSILDLERPGPGVRLPQEATRRYSFLNMLYWLDTLGTQTDKWSIRKTTTPVLSAADRSYFDLPFHGLEWSASDSIGPYERGRVVESVRSRTTGEESAVLARGRRDGAAQEVVGAIESRMLSVISAVLPPEQGFAIVDHDGLVQFHSDPSRNLRENLFDELGSDAALRSAIQAGREYSCRTTYHTSPATLRTAPLRGTPWSLVVFQDMTAQQRSALEVLALTLLCFCVHMSIVLTLSTAAFLWLPARRRSGEARRLWFWPDPDNRGRYALVLGVFAAIGITGGALIVYSEPWLVLGTSLAVALLALLAFHVGLRAESLGTDSLPAMPASQTPVEANTKHPDRSRGWHVLYVAMMATLAILIGVIPVLGYWRVAHDDEVLARLKAQQLAFADAMRTRQLDKLEWYRDVPLSGAARDSIARNITPANSRALSLGIYTTHSWQWQYDRTGGRDAVPSRPVSRSLLVESLRRFLSTHGLAVTSTASPVSQQRPELGRAQRSEDTLVFRAEPIPGGYLGSRSGSSPGPVPFQTLTIKSPVHRLTLAAVSDVWSGLALVLLLCLFARVVWMALCYAFVEPPLALRAIDGVETLRETPRPRRALLIRFPLEPRLRAACHVIGARRIRDAIAMDVLVADIVRSKKAAVLLAEFDQDLRDAMIVGRKLDLLEALNALDPPVEVFLETAVEPLYFLTSRLNEHFTEARTLGIEIDRWAAALQSYVRLRAPVPRPRRDLKADKTIPEGLVALEEECPPGAFIPDQTTFIRSRVRIAELSRDEVIAVALDLFLPHYRRIWKTCSTEEKLLLFRIATEGLANHNAKDILQPLLRRGLVVMDPNCRLMNESFRLFVLGAEPPEVFVKWGRRGGPSAWTQVQTPILFAVAVLGVFFFTTQHEAFSQLLALFAALGVSVPTLIGVIGRFARPDQAAPKS